MANWMNAPLVLTSYETSVLTLLQQLYPLVNYIDLVFCVLCNDIAPADLNEYTILVLDLAGDLFGPPGQ